MMQPVPAGSNGQVMQPDVWYCDRCQSDIFPESPRMGEGHIATRFGRDNRQYDVYEGDEKLLRVFEVMAGPGGWVIECPELHTDPSLRERCFNCGCQILRRVRYGDNFRVVRTGKW